MIYSDEKSKAWGKKIIKDKIIFLRLKQEGNNYYKPILVNDYWSIDYIEYKRNGDKTKLCKLNHTFITLDHIYETF